MSRKSIHQLRSQPVRAKESMRRLILQMQLSIDGFVSADDSGRPWQVWNWGPEWAWDSKLRQDFNATFQRIDTILLSRKMAEDGYVDHWARMARQHRDEVDWTFASRIGEARKVVITSKITESRWPSTTIASGTLAEEVDALKRAEGKDIACFGGAGFASALIQEGLVDEFQLYVNPAAVGSGKTIFRGVRSNVLMDRLSSRAYDCGIVVNRYMPRENRPTPS